MSITSDLDHWYFVILHKYNTDFPPKIHSTVVNTKQKKLRKLHLKTRQKWISNLSVFEHDTVHWSTNSIKAEILSRHFFWWETN